MGYPPREFSKVTGISALVMAQWGNPKGGVSTAARRCIEEFLEPQRIYIPHKFYDLGDTGALPANLAQRVVLIMSRMQRIRDAEAAEMIAQSGLPGGVWEYTGSATADSGG
jgi:hypothetical protein